MKVKNADADTEFDSKTSPSYIPTLNTMNTQWCCIYIGGVHEEKGLPLYWKKEYLARP